MLGSPAVLLYTCSMAFAPNASIILPAAASRRGKLRHAALKAAMSDSSCRQDKRQRQQRRSSQLCTSQ
jgi:hypothetical protein